MIKYPNQPNEPKVKKLANIPANNILLMSKGECSDYQIFVVAKTKVELDPNLLQKEYLEIYPEQNRDYAFNQYKFTAWLISKNLIEEIPYNEWLFLSSNIKGNEVDLAENNLSLAELIDEEEE